MTLSPTLNVGSTFRFRLACSACRTLAAVSASRASFSRCWRVSRVHSTTGTPDKREVGGGEIEGRNPSTDSKGETPVELFTARLIASSTVERYVAFCCRETYCRRVCTTVFFVRSLRPSYSG